MNNGILAFIAQNIENIFSNKTLFLAIPIGISILSDINSISSKGKSRKFLN